MFRAAFHSISFKALRTLHLHVIQNIWQYKFRTSPNRAKLVASLKRMTFQRIIGKIVYNMLHVVCCISHMPVNFQIVRHQVFRVY